MPSLSERKEELDRAIVGWLKPVFEHQDPVTGRKLPGFTVEDARMIAAGYACPACYACFGIARVQCPVCYLQFRDFTIDEFPDEWTDHLRDREQGVPATKPLTIDDALGALERDKDVERHRL